MSKCTGITIASIIIIGAIVIPLHLDFFSFVFVLLAQYLLNYTKYSTSICNITVVQGTFFCPST